MDSKRYLGDGVYVEVDPDTDALTLTTENGYEILNRIVLEPAVLVAFFQFVSTFTESTTDDRRPYRRH